MNIQFFFKDVTPHIEEEVREYFAKKISKLERRLSHYQDQDTVQLQIHVEQYSKKEAGSVEFILTIPHHKIVAKEDSHLYTKAIDDALDRLIRQLNDIKDKYASKR